MQTFRAYIADAAGTITWAAWIEADHPGDARRQADALRAGAAVDLWSAASRDPAPGSRLEAV